MNTPLPFSAETSPESDREQQMRAMNEALLQSSVRQHELTGIAEKAEAKWRDSEARLQLALDAAEMGTFVWHVQEDRSEPDASMLALFGLPADAKLDFGTALAAMIHPADGGRYAAAVARATEPRADGELLEDVRIFLPDGSQRWLSITARTLFDAETGHPTQMAGVALDISERKRAEHALRESEERFRSFAENSTDVLWIANAATRQLEYLSPSFAALWGESRERVMTDIGRWSELVHPDDRVRAGLAIARCLAGETVMQSYRIIRPFDRAERWIQDTGFPIRDEKGRITRVGGIAQDLTERTRAELEVKAKRHELRILVETIPQLVWRAVAGGDWTWASPQWTEFTGKAEKESHGRGWLEPIHPDDREGAREAWRNAESQGRYEADYRLRSADGTYRWFQARATPIHSDDGSLVDWFGTSTDVDDIRRFQEHEKLLLAELQHRVRNTLAVVRSIVRRSAQSATDVEDYTMHLEGRIDAFARVQASITRDPARGVDLEYLVAEQLRAVGAREGDTATIDGPEVKMSASAAETMSLAIHELATNAMKYGALTSPRGEVQVKWSVVDGDGSPHLDFRWTEQGMRLTGQPTRQGFGTMILTRTLGYELKAETDLAFPPTGLAYRVTVPLRRLTISKQTDFAS